MQIVKQLKTTISSIISAEFSLDKLVVPEFEHPNRSEHGDYSTNLALQLFNRLDSEQKQHRDIKSSRDLAVWLKTKIVAAISEIGLDDNISQITVAGPGFINFYFSSQYFLNQIQIINQNHDFFWSNWGQNKTWVIEHTSPNPNKAMHLGHLRNNVTAMAVANLWEAIGVNVIRDAVDNNRGIAIARLMWGYLKYARSSQDLPVDIDYWFEHQDQWQTPADKQQRPDIFVDQLYTQASQEFKQDPAVEKMVRQMVVDWENEDQKSWALWERVLQYSHQGQNMTLARLGNQWDKVWHEHEHYQQGKQLVEAGLEKGIFRKLEDGAVLTNLEKFDLPDTIVRKSDGTALYITQDLALTKLKVNCFKADRLFWVVGPDQSLALKQMFACCEQLGIAQVDDLTHLDYGYMSIKGKGKMSSRLGNIVYIDDLINEVKQRVQAIMKTDGMTAEQIDQLSEQVALGAVKYSILKVGRRTDMAFDFDESLDLNGNSGPYLQYTHARARSVLEKAQKKAEISQVDTMFEEQINSFKLTDLDEYELAVLSYIYRFPEVVQSAGLEYEPSQLATYLFELAQKFNSFYNHDRILEAAEQQQAVRISLTQAVAEVIQQGLSLLGIGAPEKM